MKMFGVAVANVVYADAPKGSAARRAFPPSSGI